MVYCHKVNYSYIDKNGQQVKKAKDDDTLMCMIEEVMWEVKSKANLSEKIFIEIIPME